RPGPLTCAAVRIAATTMVATTARSTTPAGLGGSVVGSGSARMPTISAGTASTTPYGTKETATQAAIASRRLRRPSTTANATWAGTCAAALAATSGPVPSTAIASVIGAAASQPAAAGPKRRSISESSNMTAGASTRTMPLTLVSPTVQFQR